MGMGKYKGYMPFTDRLDTVFSAGPDAQVIGAVLSDDEKKLIVIMKEDDCFLASVVELATHAVLQQFVIEENIGDLEIDQIYSGKGAVVYRKLESNEIPDPYGSEMYDENGDRIYEVKEMSYSYGSILACENGGYRKGFSFSVDTDMYEGEKNLSEDVILHYGGNYYDYTPTVLYDGNRLTVFYARYAYVVDDDWYYLAEGCVYEVVVCTEQGVQYRSALIPSYTFAREYAEDSRRYVRPFYVDPVTILSTGDES